MTKPTIKDIADRAGVSSATVSRVLRKQGPISAETEERVRQAAADLNFVRATAPRNLVHRSLGMLLAGVDSPSTQSSFFNEVVAGASAQADQRGLTFSMAPLPPEPGNAPALLRRGQLDGLIVAGVPLADEWVLYLQQLPIPVVFIGRYLHGEPLNHVTPDNPGGGRLAARHLLDLGHQHILILNGPQEINVFNDRLQGVLEILSSCDPACVIQQEHSFDETAGFEAVQDVLSRGDRPTAILALSDWMAIGALRALRQAGLQVPGDVSLIGFSDLPVATLLDPPLTTVRIPQRRLGRLAVHLLHALIEGDVEGPVGMVLPLDLALRASTAAPAQEGHGRL